MLSNQFTAEGQALMRSAFTVVELTITICVVAVLSAIAVPWAGELLDRVHIRGAVLEIESTFSGRAVRAGDSRDRHRDSDTLRQCWSRHASKAQGWSGSRSSALGESCADVLLSDWHGIRCREPQRLRATERVRRYRFCVATGSPSALIDAGGAMSTGSCSLATATATSDVVPKS